MNFMGIRGLEFGAIIIILLIAVVLLVDKKYHRRKIDKIKMKLKQQEEIDKGRK